MRHVQTKRSDKKRERLQKRTEQLMQGLKNKSEIKKGNDANET